MSEKNKRCVYGGYSIRGGSHLQRGVKKQDYVLVKRIGKICIAVAADGVGSHLHSDIGSRCVCEAVEQAAAVFAHGIEGREQDFIETVIFLWKRMIYPYPERECGTTCLFAVNYNNSRVLLGQVGDGMLCYEYEDMFYTLSEKDDDFVDVTHTVSSGIDYWTWRLLDVAGKPFSLYMHTDGIDILPQKRESLLREICENIGLSGRYEASMFIKGLIDQCWNEDSDDITMAFMKIPG